MDTQRAVMAEDVQMAAKPRRRTYTAEYKRRILKEADACTTPGAVGALLRREWLYSSHLVVWRRARGRGELAAARGRDLGHRVRRGRQRVPEADLRFHEVGEEYRLDVPERVDLVISLVSWGFHYPVPTYVDQMRALHGSGGRVILDVRRGTDGKAEVEARFPLITTISETWNKERVAAFFAKEPGLQW